MGGAGWGNEFGIWVAEGRLGRPKIIRTDIIFSCFESFDFCWISRLFDRWSRRFESLLFSDWSFVFSLCDSWTDFSRAFCCSCSSLNCFYLKRVHRYKRKRLIKKSIGNINILRATAWICEMVDCQTIFHFLLSTPEFFLRIVCFSSRIDWFCFHFRRELSTEFFGPSLKKKLRGKKKLRNRKCRMAWKEAKL